VGVNMKLWALVAMGSAALFALVLASGVSGLAGISQLSANTARITDSTVPGIITLGKLSQLFELARVRAAGIAVDVNDADRRATAHDMDTLHADIDTLIASYDTKVAPDSRERATFVEMRAAWGVLKARLDDLRKDALAGRKDAAQAALKTTLRPAAKQLRDVLVAETNYRLAEENSSKAAMEQASQTAFTRTLAISLVGGLVSLAVAWLFRARLTQPLAQLGQAMEAMGQGDVDIAVPGIAKADELGAIARALDGIKASINARAMADAAAQMAVQEHVTSALDHALGELKSGNLTYRVVETFPQQYEGLRHDFNATLESLAEQITAVARSSGAVRNSANEISAAAQDLARRTENQAASISDTATTMRELTASVSEAGSAVGAATQNAQETQTEAGASGQLMEQAVATMNAIAGTSDKMRSIVDLIDGISFQTNLLALNAGVEAARAGDAGKGFAVVATEVRNLAERSAQAAKDIKQLIADSGQEVSQGVAVVAQTKDSLERIVTKAAHLAGTMAGLREKASEQAQQLQLVSGTVGELDKATQQNAALVEESSAAAHTLASAAGDLAQVVQRFRLGGDGGGFAPAPQPKPVRAPAPRPAPSSAPSFAPALATHGNAALAVDDWSSF
jgi:methyl-accepting chemotaxis protein